MSRPLFKATRFVLTFILVISTIAPALYAWGERGHRAVASSAAQLLDKQGAGTKYDRAFGNFMSDHRLQLAHLANVPDISWRDRDRYGLVVRLNELTHYTNVEQFLGRPDKEFKSESDFYEAIIKLPTSYAELLKKYDGMPAKIGDPAAKLQIFAKAGTAPWRVQQLYDLLISAFKCARLKEKSAPAKDVHSPNLIQFSQMFGMGSENSVSDAASMDKINYRCDPKASRLVDEMMALGLAGVMGHHVGDLAQPYHGSADYDGWVTGNGGIHKYFEHDVVNAYDEKLEYEVTEAARHQNLTTRPWIGRGITSLQKFLSDTPQPAAALMLRLVADSLSHRHQVKDLDDKFAISGGKGRSSVFDWGVDAQMTVDTPVKKAKRDDPSNPRVANAFHGVIVDRLSIGAYLLAELWQAAWEKGDRPMFATFDVKLKKPIQLPYLLDFPFVWPTYDPKAVDQLASQFK